MNNSSNSNSSTASARSRKHRSSSARGGRGKVVERQVSADGVYTNHRFMQSVGALVGLPVLIQTKTNDTIEGVFTTFSPNFDLVLDMAHSVSRTDPSAINPETIKRKMIFSAADIVTIKVTNVDLEYATKEGFAVDQVISRFNGQVTERPLEPWQGDSNAEDNLALGEESSNGWDVDDMFRKNEEKYGVTTSYTPEMEGYTTPLNKRNTREYKEREARAQRIAAEIMSAPSTQARSEAENGDEEERYSAVVRPAEQSASGEGGGGATKYVPPMFRKKNQNTGKLMRSTPPPGQGNRYSGSNPTTPTSPSCAGPPQVSSGSHSPIGGPNGPGGASPAYPQQVPPPSTHSPSPTAHPPPHRHNSHSHTSDSKLNGDSKGSSYDRRNHDSPMSDIGRENHHNDTSNKQDHHGRQHHSEVQQQKSQQKPPPSHQHQPQHTGHMPPMGQGDHRKQAPLEQREPRKQRTNKEEQFADLKRFSQDFKLSDQPEKKAQTQQQHQQPPNQQMQQPQEPPQQVVQQHAQQMQQQPRQQPQQQPPPPLQTQQPPPPPQTQQPPPPQSQQPNPPQPQQPPPSQQPPSHMPPQQSQQRQTPPVSASTPVAQGPPQNVSQSPHHPQNPPTMTMSSVAEVSKTHEEVEKLSSAVSQSKLNPNAKEFVLNPHAKPFSPRSPSTTTPPRPHTPQTPQIQTNQPPQMAGCPTVGFPQAMVSAAYVMAASQPFAVQPTRFPKRGKYLYGQYVPIGGNQRPEYTSPMQVAAATGQPILAPAPMNSQPQALTAVQIPQNILPQTPQPYQQYPGMPMMVRFPHGGMQMVTAMVPTSGIYNQAADSQQQSQQHQAMYMTPTNLPPHQPHPAHTPGPGPQPPQPPTPQNLGGGGGPPNMPNQPPTPGPTPPQPLIYSHMGGQPSLPQHLPQHSPHPAQSPHAHQYPGQNAAAAAAAAAAAGGHHGGPGQQMQTQIVMFNPSMAPHMMHPSGPPPHSATAHIPSSMAGFTPTSSTVQHMPSAHIQYIQGTPGTHGHHMPLVRQ